MTEMLHASPPLSSAFHRASAGAAAPPKHRVLALAVAAAIEIGVGYTLLTALGVVPGPVPLPHTDGRVIPPVEKTVAPPPVAPTTFAPPVVDKEIPNEVPLVFVLDTQRNILTPQEQTKPADGTGTTPATTPAPPVTFTPPRSVPETHTTPDYPLLSRRLGEAGMVRLRLTIGLDGMVSMAAVTQSSGYARLDQAAVQWVTGHWRYQPAMKGTMPVTANMDAVITFALK